MDGMLKRSKALAEPKKVACLDLQQPQFRPSKATQKIQSSHMREPRW